MSKEYVLGTGIDELERLAFQHRLWSDAAHFAWRQAKIQMGQRVLDVGCGPGFASFDLAQMVTRQGSVIGVDESEHFIHYLNEQAKFRQLNLRGILGDVQRLPEVLRDEAPFDLAYVRWVLCFVREPHLVVQGIAQALKPGGRLVIHDYFNYQSMTAAPKHPSHDRAIAATIQSWNDRGGNTDIAGRVPRLLQDAGFELEQFQSLSRAARSNETMFQWPEVWWGIYAPKLVGMGYLSQPECDDLLRHIADLKADPTAFVQCPLVYEFIAHKK